MICVLRKGRLAIAVLCVLTTSLSLPNTIESARAQDASSRLRKTGTVRDILWVWGTTEVEKKESRNAMNFVSATALQRAEILGVPNIVMAGHGLPNDDLKADRLTGEVASGRRLIWEITPDDAQGGSVRGNEGKFVYNRRMGQVRRLVDKYPQIEGILLDDMSTEGIEHGFKPEHIREIRAQLSGKYSKVKVTGVVYTMSLDIPNIDSYIRELDEISLWVWHARDLDNLEKNVARLERQFPGKPISLGLYLFDYGTGKRMPLPVIDKQFDTALKLAHQRRIQDIVILTINDDAEAVRRAADWVNRIGKQKIGRPVVPAARPEPAKTALKVGDGRDWQFVNSTWTDGENGAISGVKTGDGDGLQGMALAFLKNRSFSDVEAEFDVAMPSNHSDAGFIVRAQDATHYYVVRFPQSGQSYRAQHSWVALTKADGSGYLRDIKLEMVPRVPSNPLGVCNRARVKVTGDRFQVWLNGYPALDVRDSTFTEGRIGLLGFEKPGFGEVRVSGKKVRSKPWNEKVVQPKNWFEPFANIPGRQAGANLTRTPSGDLLCRFTSDDKPYLARSTDGGFTWTTQESPKNIVGDIHLIDKDRGWAPENRLGSFMLSDKEGRWSESMDSGLTWSEPAVIASPKWPIDKMAIYTGWQLKLRDGSLVRFAYGALPEAPLGGITRWGAHHLTAFSVRSTDNGKSWSEPASLDGSAAEFSRPNNPMGNLDLTEPTAFETADGRLVCYIRPVYSPWMWETWSHDQGRSWGPCVRGPFPGYAPSSIVRTSGGAAVLPLRFPGLTLRTTYDDATTWAGSAYIDTSIWAMGSLCEVEPDLLLYIYMDSYGKSLRAQYIRVTPDGLQPVKPGPRK